MPVEAFSFLCNNLTNKIKKLSLFGICGWKSSQYILEEEHVIALANRCPQLEELDLGFQKTRNFEVALSTIIEKLPNLVKLRLPDDAEHIRNAKPSLIKALEKNLPNLKINEGSFDIAHPDPRYLGYLWEMQCKPTHDFY
jgi:hypothetical protein